MIRCLVVDDEPLALHILEDYIAKVPFLQLIKATTNPIEALTMVQEGNIDLVFLDVQMPELTGIQFLKIANGKTKVILTTAYSQYALEGYELDVVDYLLKPVAVERFLKACNKAFELHQLRQAGRQPAPVSQQQDFLFVNADYSLVKIMFDDILWVEGLRDYVKIHLQNNSKPVISRMSIKSLEDSLPVEGFLRIHKSYIVSVNAITAVRRNSVFMNEHELPVGDTYRLAVARLTGREPD